MQVETMPIEKTYKTNIFDLKADIHVGNSNLIWVRGKMYQESEAIRNVEEPCIIEVHGYLPLESKFRIWDQYGEPKDDLYFCVEKGKIVLKDDLALNNSIEWPVGWISKTNYVVIYVDIINLLNQYFLINEASKLIKNV